MEYKQTQYYIGNIKNMRLYFDSAEDKENFKKIFSDISLCNISENEIVKLLKHFLITLDGNIHFDNNSGYIIENYKDIWSVKTNRNLIAFTNTKYPTQIAAFKWDIILNEFILIALT